MEACGFIRQYSYHGEKYNRSIFQLVDNFTLFYFRFLNRRSEEDEKFWSMNINTPTRNTWEGLAFERVCFAHISQIKKALGISGISTRLYSWNLKSDGEYGGGAQIDMVIDRADNVVNLCEIKFSASEYAIDKSFDDSIRRKYSIFSVTLGKRKAVHLTLITPFGVKNNMYQHSVQNVITAEDLFRD